MANVRTFLLTTSTSDSECSFSESNRKQKHGSNALDRYVVAVLQEFEDMAQHTKSVLSSLGIFPFGPSCEKKLCDFQCGPVFFYVSHHWELPTNLVASSWEPPLPLPVSY